MAVFRYPPGEHDVVRVDADGYNTCTVSENPEVHSSGLDFVTLHPGENYFICGFAGHCSDEGMRIAVTTE
ncbi:hypothetical protein KSP39_PZI020573 [Platanthera zijinensis]|uniref:Phytocyanin domain-containing protein n=1 Tax=Platanthera zijinensis TaxID=2320716 RepID=A0AAP0B061_9ASPA